VRARRSAFFAFVFDIEYHGSQSDRLTTRGSPAIQPRAMALVVATRRFLQMSRVTPPRLWTGAGHGCCQDEEEERCIRESFFQGAHVPLREK
jgi:hypothetical protein